MTESARLVVEAEKCVIASFYCADHLSARYAVGYLGGGHDCSERGSPQGQNWWVARKWQLESHGTSRVEHFVL